MCTFLVYQAFKHVLYHLLVKGYEWWWTIYHENASFLIRSTSKFVLTHWGRVTHLWVSKLTNIASDNGLSPGRRQAIIWNNAGILLIGPLGTNFGEILIEIHTFSLKKIRLKMSSAKCCSFCLGLNELSARPVDSSIYRWIHSLIYPAFLWLFLFLVWVNTTHLILQPLTYVDCEQDSVLAIV